MTLERQLERWALAHSGFTVFVVLVVLPFLLGVVMATVAYVIFRKTKNGA